MTNRILSGETIDGIVLGEWLEDNEHLSRYAIDSPNDPDGDSVWVCTECEHLEDGCSCYDYEENYYDPSELDEWMDFDPDC